MDQLKVWYAPYKFESYGQDEIEAVHQCLKDGWLGGQGPRSKQFEQQVSKLFNKKHGVFVNSGSSANLLALASLNLPKHSKVVTPACTFSTTLAPIIQLGLQPIFTDVEIDTYVPSIQSIIQAVEQHGADVKAIMIPNLIGNRINWSDLRYQLKVIGRQDIILIEDSADTIGHDPVDSDISTTSFYASHVITAGGTGGMVMFNDDSLHKTSLQYRDWGRIGDDSEVMSDRFNHLVDGIPYDHKFLYGVLGYNLKCSEMNAAFGLVQLDKLDVFLNRRRRIIERYIDNLKHVEEIILPNDELKPNWLAIPLQYHDRYGLLNYLESKGIQTRVTFAGNVTRHPIYRPYFKPFENSDIIMKNGFLLGAHHGMTVQQVDYVCDHIKQYIKSTK